MGEARNVIITFLILLFVIIGLGVAFSRMSKDKTNKPILGGVLDNIFFSKSLKLTPTPKPAGIADNQTGSTITIRTGSATPTPASVYTGNNPTTIPATGTPTAVLAFSSMGLGLGYFFKRFSK